MLRAWQNAWIGWRASWIKSLQPWKKSKPGSIEAQKLPIPPAQYSVVNRKRKLSNKQGSAKDGSRSFKRKTGVQRTESFAGVWGVPSFSTHKPPKGGRAPKTQ